MSIIMEKKDGSETIEFIAFNIDGEGTSIALSNGDFVTYNKKDMKDIILGEEGKECLYHFSKKRCRFLNKLGLYKKSR